LASSFQVDLLPNRCSTLEKKGACQKRDAIAAMLLPNLVLSAHSVGTKNVRCKIAAIQPIEKLQKHSVVKLTIRGPSRQQKKIQRREKNTSTKYKPNFSWSKLLVIQVRA